MLGGHKGSECKCGGRSCAYVFSVPRVGASLWVWFIGGDPVFLPGHGLSAAHVDSVKVTSTDHCFFVVVVVCAFLVVASTKTFSNVSGRHVRHSM